jgi:hypothetical protein
MACIPLLVLAGCSITNNQFPHAQTAASADRPWTLTWRASEASQQNHTPEVAFSGCAYAQQPDGTLSQPAKVTWLATSPTYGLTLIHLDSASQYVAIGVLRIDAANHQWILAESFSEKRPTAGNGIPSSRENAWTLPQGTYQSASFDARTTEGSVMRLWLSDTQQEFVLAHLRQTIKPPSSATSLTIDGKSGWLSTQGGITIIAVNLSDGMLVFAGTTSPEASKKLVGQAMAHLGELLL